jgi:ABC-type taurine transport system ATPase subunit
MLRLVNFAMSLMGEPPILALDEPANELDPQMRRRVWDMIACLNRERSTTCVVTSVLFLVVMAAPVFIPITALPLPLQFLSYAFSPTYAADALRRLLLGDVNLSFYLDMGMLALMGVVSFYLFKRWSFWRLQ